MHQTFITETRMCIHALDQTYATSEVRGDEHRALANAIRAGDRELTDRLLVGHMDDAIAGSPAARPSTEWTRPAHSRSAHRDADVLRLQEFVDAYGRRPRGPARTA